MKQPLRAAVVSVAVALTVAGLSACTPPGGSGIPTGCFRSDVDYFDLLVHSGGRFETFTSKDGTCTGTVYKSGLMFHWVVGVPSSEYLYQKRMEMCEPDQGMFPDGMFYDQTYPTFADVWACITVH